MVGVGEWPWQAIAAVAALVATHFWKPLIAFCRSSGKNKVQGFERGWERASELESEITLLRQALHRAGVRSSAYAAAFELLLIAMLAPLELRLEAVRRAREIAEASLPDGGTGGSTK